MFFKIDCSFKHNSHFLWFGDGPSKTENAKTKKHITYWNDKYSFLQTALFISLLNAGVNGESISFVSQRSIDVAQVPIHAQSHPILRQDPQNLLGLTDEPANDRERDAILNRYSTVKKGSTSRKRTTMWFESAIDQCDYLALMCMRAYQTGKVCGKTVYYEYFTFKNYCMLDFTNCKLRYELWQAIHMGDCVHLAIRSSNVAMTEVSSKMMDEVYMVEHDFGI